MMKTLALLLLSLLGTLHSVLATDTLRPEQLSPGMKGYGLSVFKGTKPERFEVEIIGVLHNALPKQDMILIHLSGADLEKHKVIAGMSGSPVYIDGKLIGALAYGWTFENDPLAGVTPIHNMMAELKLPVVAPSTINASVSLGRTSSISAPFAMPRTAFAQASGDSGAPRALLTPLSLGGFSSRVLEGFASKFAGLGMMPIAAGGAGAGVLPRRSGDMEPGGIYWCAVDAWRHGRHGGRHGHLCRQQSHSGVRSPIFSRRFRAGACCAGRGSYDHVER